MRQAEAERAAAYWRLSIGREELDREEERLQQSIQQLANRQAQLTADILKAGLHDDANTAIQQLNMKPIDLLMKLPRPHRDRLKQHKI